MYTDLGRYDQALEAAARSLDVSAGGPIDVYDPWTLCTTARVHVAVGDEDLARSAAARAVDALTRTFDGETHRVAVELVSVAHGLGERRAALRLAGLADATPDRRELPFRSPGNNAGCGKRATRRARCSVPKLKLKRSMRRVPRPACRKRPHSSYILNSPPGSWLDAGRFARALVIDRIVAPTGAVAKG